MELFHFTVTRWLANSQTRELVDWIIRKLVKLTGIVKLFKFYIGPPI